MFSTERLQNSKIQFTRVKQVESNTTHDLNKLFEKYSKILGEDSAKIEGVQAKLMLKPNSKPVFLKTRPVP